MRGRPWSEQEDARLLGMLKDRKSHGRIAAALGRPASSIDSRIDTLTMRDPKRLAQATCEHANAAGRPSSATSASPTDRRPRRCLCCGKEFASAHAGNRLCAICRTKPTSPYAP